MRWLGLWGARPDDDADPVEMEPAQLARRLEQGEAPLILDVRQADEYAAGHIPGARLIPLDELPRRVGELDPHAEIVCVCRSGNRSGRAVEWLRAVGFAQVKNLRGGLKAWKGPLTTGPGAEAHRD